MRWLITGLASALLASVAATPAFAEWREVETDHFIIVSSSTPAEIENLATRLESYDRLMRMATSVGNDDPVKVRIYEVPGTHEIESALGLSGTGIAGFYDSNSLGPFAVTPRRTQNTGRYFTPSLVLHHEYAHHFMLQYFPAVYPRWYIEGFAELIGSSLVMDDGRIGYGMPAKHRGNNIAASWVPLTELLTKEKITYLDTYGQGWAVTHFMTFDKTRASQFRQYLGALGTGKTYEEAAKSFGNLSDLNREARRYVTSGSFEYRPVKVEILKPVIKRARIISAGEAAIIPQLISYRDDELSLFRKESERKREESLRQENLNKIREKSTQFPNEPAVLHLLAEAESAAGNLVQSEAAADHLLRVNPGHVRGLARKSILMSQAANRLSGPARANKVREAREMAARANKLATQDAMPLLAYYQSFNLVGEPVPKLAVDGLRQVVSLLPRDFRVRQLLVDRLAHEKNYDEAIAWLMPIANSPHESPRRETAREQMEQLRAAKSAIPKS